MLDNFEEQAILIQEIETIADMQLRDIKCIFKDENDYIETVNSAGVYVWDRIGEDHVSLAEIRTMLDSGYTAIPF